MTEKKVWFITGAGRGMGVDMAKAALAAGHAVVATGRDPEKVTQAVGAADDLLVVRLDITEPADTEAAVQAAVERFGHIDVLVNNAGNFIAGFFEEITPEQFRGQIETKLFGPMNITRAVLPVMRRQRSGLVIAMSSTAGLVGQEFCTAYAASKFGIEGWIESLTPEVAPFGIRTMIVEPGFFRTELLEAASTTWRRSGQARRGPGRPRRPGPTAAALGGGCRRGRHDRAEGERSARPGRYLPRAVLVTGHRSGLTSDVTH